MAKGCRECGEPKPAGRGRQFCDSCLTARQWTCAKCGRNKQVSDLGLDRSRPGGVHPYCLPCRRAINKDLAERRPDRKRAMHLRRNYGISLEDYDTMLAQQGGTCAICDGPPNSRWNRFNVDHSHVTGEVRGLLCVPCNQAVGHFYDDPERCLRAAEYLRSGK